MRKWTLNKVEIKICEAMQFGDHQYQVDRWLEWLSHSDRNIVKMRCSGQPWKVIAKRQSIDKTTASLHYMRSIAKICGRLRVANEDIAA